MNESTYIVLLTQKIENSLSWRPSSQWAEYDFKKLSDLIYQKTNIVISPLTLKRIFKNASEGSYNPKQGTKDALAQYLEFKDWQDFIESNRDKSILITETADNQNDSTTGIDGSATLEAYNQYRKYISNRRKKILIPVFTAVIILIVFYGYKLFHKEIRVTEHAKLIADTDCGLPPLTVSFDYDVTGIQSENIQFTITDPRFVTRKIEKKKHFFNHCFEIPGTYYASINVDNVNIKTVCVTVKSEHWFSTFFGQEQHGVFQKVFKTPLDTFLNDTLKDGILYFTPEYLKNAGVDTKRPYFLNNQYYDDFKTSADSFSLDVRFRNSLEHGGICCQGCQFNIISNNGTVYLGMTNKRCYSYTAMHIGTINFSGTTDSIAFLGIDMNQWNELKIENIKPCFRLILNSDTIYATSHPCTLGIINGFNFTSQGSAEYDYIRLYNAYGNLVYGNEFD